VKKKVLILGVSSFGGLSAMNFFYEKNFEIVGTYNKMQNIGKIYQKNIKLKKIELPKDIVKLIQIIKNFKPHYILDFASVCMVNESWDYPENYFSINVVPKIKLIKEISNFKFIKKFVYISTPEVFGKNKNDLKEDLNDFKPSTPYATSKLAVENIIRNYSFSKKFVIVRFSNFYGPRQPNYRLIPKIIISLKKNIKFPLHGSGKSLRNFIYSEDFCSGIYKVLLKKNTLSVYHFSGSSFYTVRDIIVKICKIMDKNPNKYILKTHGRISQDPVYFLNSEKTRKHLNWIPKFSITRGLKKTVDYFVANHNILKKRPNYYKHFI